jgi:fimbrial chaperone protein
VDGQEHLEPTRELMVSPPMLQLPVQGRQLVRVIRNGPPPTGPAEAAYRVLVDELPLPQADGKKGLNFVMRHSLPIFVTPAGAPPSPPQLSWTLRRQDGQAVLEVANSGGTHAQLADLVFTDAAGQRTTVHAGLLGYVLPGATMHWPLKALATTFDATGGWQVMINGTVTSQTIAPPDRAR